MSRDHPATAWLFIVPAAHSDLFDRLAPRLNGMARVILDRRQGQRRRTRVPVSVERRLGDRLRPVATGRVHGDNGYHLVYDGTDHAVYEAGVRVPAVCVACGTVLTFEMPRFVEAPAYFHLNVAHPPAARGVQHVVDLEAVSGTGRTLLACRLRAERKLLEEDEGASPPAPGISPAATACGLPVLQDGKTKT